MKIYIIGPVGSGKTTLARELSKKYNIQYYELDKIVWDDATNTKRNKKEIKKLFNNILKKDNWIIEDVGRDIFKLGIEVSDIVYYIKHSKVKLYYRCIKRYIKQKIGLEEYNYKPSIKGLIDMFKWVNKDLASDKLEYIKNNSKKYIIKN